MRKGGGEVKRPKQEMSSTLSLIDDLLAFSEFLASVEVVMLIHSLIN